MKKMIKMKKFVAVLVAIAALSCGWAALAGGAEIGFYQQGDVNLNGPAYDWWYGCSPTSAGMMMGYYDIKGYGGLYYSNLVPGGVAEATTFPASNQWNYLVKNIIASQGYVNDYYRNAIGVPDLNSSGNNAVNIANDDVANPTHNANCLTDFMGSGQDAVGNANGWTTFWYWNNGAKFTAADARAQNVWNSDGMYGMDEYFRYAGYGTGLIADDTSFYTWHIKSRTRPLGCTFADYQTLINAGLVAMIQIDGHSMFGYGYDDQGNIIFHDTWDGLEHSMVWGGSYHDMYQWGITVFTPSGGVVPLPPSLLLMISGLAGLAGWRVRFRQK
jgi:hypothetical protein